MSVESIALPAGRKLESLEAIRGLAALTVMIGHLVYAFMPEPYFVDAARQTYVVRVGLPGRASVSVFFVLSGFVLSLSFFQRGSNSALASAAVRRYPRLMLPVLATVLFAFLLMRLGCMANLPVAQHVNAAAGLENRFGPDAVPSRSWLTSFYNFPPVFQDALKEGLFGAFRNAAMCPYDLVLWTMPYELRGSFLVFAFLALFGAARRRWVFYGALGAMCYKTLYFEFLLGMALSDLWTLNQRGGRLSLPLAIGVAAALGGLYYPAQLWLKALLLIAAVAFTPGLQRFLETRWLALLGRLSFPLYLLHMPVFCSLGCRTYLLCVGSGAPHAVGVASACATATLGSFVAAWFMHRWVDEPALALVKFLDQRFFQAHSPPPPDIAVLQRRAA